MFPFALLLGSGALFREDPLAAVVSRGHWCCRTAGSHSLSDSTGGCNRWASSARNVRSSCCCPHPARPTRCRISGDLRDGGADRDDGSRSLLRLGRSKSLRSPTPALVHHVHPPRCCRLNFILLETFFDPPPQ